jgi:ribosomal-protein-alanine N-acetyltransferase
VLVRTVRPGDVEPYRRAVESSRARLARWNPVDPGDLARHLARQSDGHRTFLVLARDDEGGHGVVGRVNLTNVVHGRFQSGVLGYDAFDPYAGRGLFGEGLALVVGLALRPVASGGFGLHRVEANVQPGNAPSAGLLRSLGFRHEGRTPRMLLLAGPSDGERWRDHERYAVTAEEWPAPAYQRQQHRRLVVLVGGPAQDRRAALAGGLCVELGLPLLVGATPGAPAAGAGCALPPSVLWAVLAGSPTGAVLDAPWAPGASAEVRTGLGAAGVAASDAVQVWCPAPVGHPSARPAVPAGGGHGDARPGWGLRHTLTLAADAPLVPAEVTRLALAARALATG